MHRPGFDKSEKSALKCLAGDSGEAAFDIHSRACLACHELTTVLFAASEERESPGLGAPHQKERR